MSRTLLIGTVVALAVVAAPLALADEPYHQYPGRDRGIWQPSAYDQKYVEPGPRIPTPPKDPDASRTTSISGLDGSSVREGAPAAVGFSGGRAGKRTVREVERDSVRQTIRRLG